MVKPKINKKKSKSKRHERDYTNKADETIDAVLNSTAITLKKHINLQQRINNMGVNRRVINKTNNRKK